MPVERCPRRSRRRFAIVAVLMTISEPFWLLFAGWASAGARRDDPVLGRLIASYRNAWERGDREDRYAVIELVQRASLTEGSDLIIDGLGSEDERLAIHAAAHALALLERGFSFASGSGVRGALVEFGRRHPGSRALSDAALSRLDTARR